MLDRTALQRDANRLLGFTAQQTLDYAQSLYEKRLITYPRTDSRFLTEDMAASLPGLTHELRLMQCYLMPDETALRELSEGVIEKLKLLTDAEFAKLEFPPD